jgi:hypothetical protein
MTRLLVRLRKRLQRLEERRRLERVMSMQPVDTDWYNMLAQINSEDRERRLRRAEQALNQLSF